MKLASWIILVEAEIILNLINYSGKPIKNYIPENREVGIVILPTSDLGDTLLLFIRWFLCTILDLAIFPTPYYDLFLYLLP
jgi:hypothetical protein